MKTFNKHVRWRVDKKDIFICDCKRLIDLKVPLKFKEVMGKFSDGLNERDLKGKENLLFSDFTKLKFLCNLEICQIKKDEFLEAMGILDKGLSKRVRDNKFLSEKFEKFPEFFIGIFLDNEVVGVICGFPREDYLLISEIAVDSRFQGRGFGTKLIKCFEEVASHNYKKINVGAQDDSIGFYNSLGYKPFLLIQYKKGDYSVNEFIKNFKIKKKRTGNNYVMLDIEIDKPDLNLLRRYKKKYPKAYFQYIFSKEL